MRATSVRRSPRDGCVRTRSRPPTEARGGHIRPAMPAELSVPKAGAAIAIITGVSARAIVRALESRVRLGSKSETDGPPNSMAPAISQRRLAACDDFGCKPVVFRSGRRNAKAISVAQAQPIVCEVSVDSASGRAADIAQRLAPTMTSRTKGHQRRTLVRLVWMGKFS
jgi:hypothetical protein